MKFFKSRTSKTVAVITPKSEQSGFTIEGYILRLWMEWQIDIEESDQTDMCLHCLPDLSVRKTRPLQYINSYSVTTH